MEMLILFYMYVPWTCSGELMILALNASGFGVTVPGKH